VTNIATKTLIKRPIADALKVSDADFVARHLGGLGSVQPAPPRLDPAPRPHIANTMTCEV
jgi:hypothetical protein